MQERSQFTGPGAQVRRRKRALFVGYGNSCRSQMAETFARHYGMGFLDAASAGLEPDEEVTEQARRLMAECGIPISEAARPKLLSAFDLTSFDLIVFLTEFDIPIDAEAVMKIRTPDTRRMDDRTLQCVRNEIDARVLEIVSDLRPAPRYRPILLTYRDVPAAARV